MPDDHRHPSREEQQREEQRQRERKEREREREQREREKHEREAKQRKEREKKEAARSKEQREKREKDEDGKPRTPGQRNVTSSASPPSRHHTREYALPPSRSLPGQQRVSDGNELRDLAVGTLVVALTIFALFVNSARGARAKRTRAINRAHSCPALVELKSTRALDACAEMLAAFDENSNGRVERRPTLQPSLTALTECDRETLSAWATPRQSPRDSPRDSPRQSPRQSRRQMRHVTPDEALERPARPHLFVLGDAGVGKSTIIDVLEGFADSRGVDLEVWEGAPSNREALAVAVPLVVWDAVDEGRGPLKEYVHRHLTSATSKCSPPLSHKEREALFSRTIVVCNKSDVAGCPLPEMQALPSGTLFLAGSATRGTNMRELWRRVETCAAPPDCSFNATSYPPMEGIALVERSFSMDEYALQHQAMLANESSSSGSSSSGTNGAARTGQWGSPLMEPNAAQLDAAQHELAAYIRGAEAVEMMAAYGTSVNAH